MSTTLNMLWRSQFQMSCHGRISSGELKQYEDQPNE
jgi:hypothetical protein